MQIAAAPAVTLIFAAALALINLWLSLRVARTRAARGIMVGQEGAPDLVARGRAHANFNEYVPIALILMLMVEMRVGPHPLLWAAGAGLAVGRVLHPFGMERPTPNALRIGGMALTYLATVGLIVWAVLIAYGVVR